MADTERQYYPTGVGDIGLLDSARPSTRLSEIGAQWLSIYPPRQSLIPHLGFEPQACLRGSGETLAARVLRQLVLDGIGDEESTAVPVSPHMRLALYDLLGAVFAPSDPWPGSRHPDKLFARIRRVISDGFADPNFGPNEVAAETGISLRYLQKLSTERGSTCSELIFFASFGSRRAPCASPGVTGNKPVSQRDRLRLRLSRLYPFRTEVSSSVRSRPRRPFRRA